MKKLIYLLVLLMLVSGCIPLFVAGGVGGVAIAKTRRAEITNKISLGMTKSEVIKAIGKPTSSKGAENEEVLEYVVPGRLGSSKHDTVWVILEDGKVTKYGRAGDFGTAMPEDRRQYDITIQNK